MYIIIIKKKNGKKYENKSSIGTTEVSKESEVVENFSQVEVSNVSKEKVLDLNYLNKNAYIIDEKLQHYLKNGHKVEWPNRKIVKGIPGIYVVVFKKIKNKDKDVLVYNYVYYDYIFNTCVNGYIYNESNRIFSFDNYSTCGDFLFVVEGKIFRTNKEFLNSTTDIFEYYR